VTARVPCLRAVQSVAADSVAVNGGDGAAEEAHSGFGERPRRPVGSTHWTGPDSLGTLPFAWAGPATSYPATRYPATS
jgi:hypothetical protein